MNFFDVPEVTISDDFKQDLIYRYYEETYDEINTISRPIYSCVMNDRSFWKELDDQFINPPWMWLVTHIAAGTQVHLHVDYNPPEAWIRSDYVRNFASEKAKPNPYLAEALEGPDGEKIERFMTERKTAITIPMWPEGDDYVVCNYPESNDDQRGWSEHAYVLRPDVPHEVPMTKYDRFNVQGCYNYNINDLYDIYTEGMLVKS